MNPRDDVAEILAQFRLYSELPDGLGANPFKLGCSFDNPATVAEIVAAWLSGVPDELAQLWLASRQSRLFEDLEYGQWGIALLSPDDAVERTLEERLLRPDSYRSNDFVIGEVLGDQELVVLAPTETGHRRVLISLPLDDRPDWYPAGTGVVAFLNAYLATVGEKFWEKI